MRLKLTRRTDDVLVCIEGEPEAWGRGLNWSEAIGNLVLAHPNRFGLDEIEENPGVGKILKGRKETAVI